MTLVQALDIFLPLLGVLLVGVLVPVYLVGKANADRRDDNERADRMHREDREADWKRQDEVAERAEKAKLAVLESQRLISDQATEAARLLLDTNKEVEKKQAETNGMLNVIHTLVNSNMTAAMQAEFDATQRELAMMKEVMALKGAAGLEPTPEVLAAISSTQDKLAELASALSDRAKAQAKTLRDQGAGGEA